MSKITLKKTDCIGCGACVATCDKFFEMNDEGKAHIKGADNGDMEELEVKDAGCAKEAVDVCPVQVIKVE